MNVLILSAAAKVLLVQAFAGAARPRGGRVIAADLSPDNAALFAADQALLLPRSDAAGFADALADACVRHGVRLVVPTRDGELEVLSRLAPALAAQGVVVLAPSAEALAVCRDKRRFVEFCGAHGFGVPRTYGEGEMPDRFPVFVRPVEGAGGKGARKVERAQDLGPGLLVQDFDDGPEYSVDVLMDLQGRPLQAVARRRLHVRDGEAVKSQVEAAAAAPLAEQALALCAALGLVGHNVVQAFYDPERGARFIEVNPRFGGASNLSIQAGLASPERILQMIAGEAAAAVPRPIRDGLMMLRYSQDRLATPDEIAGLAT